MQILFVDNHPEFTAMVIASFLREHEVVTVPTIAAAREQLGRGRFDVVLIDYDLDDGKGDALVHWIRSTHRGMTLIGVSARDDGNQRLRDAGVDAVCAKLAFAQISTVLRSVRRVTTSA